MARAAPGARGDVSAPVTDRPLIVTAQLPPELQARATALRTAHFPPERNFLAAHVTLFHAIPALCEGELRQVLKALAREHAPVPAKLLGIMNLGGGTALKLESPAMLALREQIAERFHGMLTAQDQHKPRLHVTVQNKVTSSAARALQEELGPQIMPQGFAFTGLELFRYLGGPWELLGKWRFSR